MPKWRFWEKEPTREQSSALPGRTATAGEPVVPHAAPPRSQTPAPERIATLKRRRDGILFERMPTGEYLGHARGDCPRMAMDE